MAVLGGLNFYEAGVNINLVSLTSNDHLFLHLMQKKLCRNPLLDCGGGRWTNIFACKFYALSLLKSRTKNKNQNEIPII